MASGVMSSVQAYIRSFPCAKSLCMEASEWIDPIGRHWCIKHRDRYLLMKYGQQHRWAAIMSERGVLLPQGIENYIKATHMWKEPCIKAVVDEIRCFVDPMVRESEHVA